MAQIQEIVVPYNFIPVSSWVFNPEWAEETYHDIPFSDGLSGRIDYTLTNYSPLCVGHSQTNDRHLKWERDADNHLVIPGSSIKGMLRTALEIVSFGRMQFFYDRKHAFRLKIGAVKGLNSKYKLIPIFVRPRSDGTWEYFETDYSPDFKPMCASVSEDILKSRFNLTAKATATEKYESLFKITSANEIPLLYAELKDKKGCSVKQMMKDESDRRYTFWREVVDFSYKPGPNRYAGMFMFMNENISMNSNGKANKYCDYFFYVKNIKRLDDQNEWKQLDKGLIEDLNMSLPPVKADSNGFKADNLYNYVHNHMNQKYGFPVWYLKGEGESRDAIGFCQVMRKTYDKSVGDLVRNGYHETVNTELPDLTDLMFGFTDSDAGKAMGSRIGFSDLRSVDIPQLETKQYVLGEPKSSFYPVYLGKFNKDLQYNDDDSRIAGRKLYKIRNDLKLADSNITGDNEKVRTAIDFASAKTKFKGTVVFNNLRPEELGALLWVMSFGKGTGTESSDYYHSLGHARPMGAGAVKLSLSSENIHIPEYLMDGDNVLIGDYGCPKNELIQKCLDKFVALMNRYYPFGKPDEYKPETNNWYNSVIIKKYLDNAKIDPKALCNKVYNEFPVEFGEIKKSYDNKGMHDNGKKSGDYCDSERYEQKFDISRVINERQKIFKIHEQEAETALKKQKLQDDVLNSYRECIKSRNFIKALAIAIVYKDNNGNELSEYNNDKSQGIIPDNFAKCGNFNQLIKQIVAVNLSEEKARHAADDIVETINCAVKSKKEIKDSANKLYKKQKNNFFLGYILEILPKNE